MAFSVSSYVPSIGYISGTVKGRAVYCKKFGCQKIRKNRKREKKLNYMKEYNAAPKVEQKDEAADIDKLIA